MLQIQGKVMNKSTLTPFIVLLLMPLAALAYDVNGVGLGSKEGDVKKAFPSALCKALEWKTNAADRRCDDGRIAMGGIEGKATFYLKADVIQGFGLRFDIKELERVKANLRQRWGAPLSEATDVIAQKDKPDRKIYKARWEKGADLVILTAQLDGKRVIVEISRGNFNTEIDKVR
jgi:hypothetical protein